MLEYQFSEDDDDGEVDRPLSWMTPSLSRRGDAHRLLHDSARRRRIDETMRVSFLGTLPEEEWERQQSELERNTGVA